MFETMAAMSAISFFVGIGVLVWMTVLILTLNTINKNIKKIADK